jgi:hypothetical protein
VAVYGAFGVALAGALAAAALAATAALAVFCFVKVIGLVLLGAPRRAECASATDTVPAMRGALVFLAGLCLLLGVVPGLLVPTLARLGPGDARLAQHAGIVLPGTGGLPTLGLALALVVVVVGLWRARSPREAAPTPAWACGQRVEPALAWTSAGFTKPLRLVTEGLLRPRREQTVHAQAGVVQEIVYEAEVPHLFDTLLYEPITAGAMRGASLMRRLQSGSLRTYLIYLLALVALLLALVRTGALL